MNEPSEQSINLAKRNELQEFIVESKARLKQILKRLQWDTQACPRERVTPKDTKEDDDSEPELPASYATSNSIVTDVKELRKIVGDPKVEVPKKFSDLQLNFTAQQKLAIYEQVIAHTEKCQEPQITVPALKEGALTFAEIVAQKKRETKKRRRYRQSKPTHIEKVRAMVDLQMQALQQYNNAKAEEERKTKEATYERHRQRTDRNRSPEGRKAYYRIKHRSRSRSTELKDLKSKRRRSRSRSKSQKHTKIKHRNRSRSPEHKNHKSKRPRSRSRSKTHKRNKQKAHKRDRSNSRDRNIRKRRSRSRSKNKKRKSHKRRTRSRSLSAIRGNSHSHSINKVHHRKSEINGRLWNKLNK